jgi:hypothetical protein
LTRLMVMKIACDARDSFARFALPERCDKLFLRSGVSPEARRGEAGRRCDRQGRIAAAGKDGPWTADSRGPSLHAIRVPYHPKPPSWRVQGAGERPGGTRRAGMPRAVHLLAAALRGDFQSCRSAHRDPRVAAITDPACCTPGWNWEFVAPSATFP